MEDYLTWYNLLAWYLSGVIIIVAWDKLVNGTQGLTLASLFCYLFLGIIGPALFIWIPFQWLLAEGMDRLDKVKIYGR